MCEMVVWQVEHLVTECEALSGQLEGLQPLKEAARRARAEQLQKPGNYPYLETLEALVGRGKPISIRLAVLSLHALAPATSISSCCRGPARVFLKKNSAYNLLEVLSPRYEFDSNEKLEKKRERKLAEEQPVRHPIFQGLTLSAAQLSDPREIVEAFKQAEQRHPQSLWLWLCPLGCLRAGGSVPARHAQSCTPRSSPEEVSTVLVCLWRSVYQ